MLEVIEQEKIENMIFEIRGKQVMVDSDIAYLFGYETKNLNRQVQRNIDRFPENYCFQLTEEEYQNLRCQNGTSSSKSNYGGRRYLPYVFTEHGITMLAGLLKSDVAVKMSLRIVDTFISMRKFINNNIDMFKELDKIKNLTKDIDEIKTLTIKHTNDIEKNSKLINELQNSLNKYKDKINYIFYKGQVYDAYSKIIEIFKNTKKELIIIDGYADKTVLDIIKNLKVKVTLITKNNGLLSNIDIQKYNVQYHNLIIKNTDLFHDRYFIIDYDDIYHCGTSINHAGSKTFSINMLEDDIIKNSLINYVKQMV